MWTIVPTPHMEVHTFATEGEGVNGNGEKAWYAVDACRWTPYSNPDCLEVRIAGTDVCVKVPLAHVNTDIHGIGWAETRRWRGLDPTAPPPPPPPLSTPPSSRKRESSSKNVSATKRSKPAAKKPATGGDKSGDKKPAAGAAGVQQRKSVRTADTLRPKRDAKKKQRVLYGHG